MRANRLKNLRITRVDLVDQGANFDPQTGEGAHVLLYKSMTCKECGKPLSKGDLYCKNCGAKARGNAAKDIEADEADTIELAQRKKRKKLKRLLGKAKKALKRARKKLRKQVKREKRALKKATKNADLRPEQFSPTLRDALPALPAQPHGQSSKAEWDQYILALAKQKGFTLDQFLQTTEGQQLYTSRNKAPVGGVPALGKKAKKAAPTSLSDLREAAEEEGQHETPAQVDKRIAEDAREEYPILPENVAIEKFLKRHPDRWEKHRAAFRAPTQAREAFAEALIKDELGAITEMLESDGLDNPQVEALKMLPGFASVRSDLVSKARAGASISELESGHKARSEMISKLLSSARAVAKKHSTGEEPKPITNHAALRKVLANRPGLAVAAQTGDTDAPDTIDIEKLASDPVAYESYRRRSYAGKVGGR